MTDIGAQHIKMHGTNSEGDMTGTRSDGAKVVIKPASADKAGVVHVKNVTPTFVHRLYFAEQIGDKEIQACEMLQEHHFEAGLEPRICASYNPVQTGGRKDLTDSQELHRKRFNAAVTALKGYGNTVQMAVLHDVQPQSMKRLRDGLKLLINHYGI